MEFQGAVYPVHPARAEVEGLPCFGSVDDLPEAPDAAFVGVRRDLTVSVVRSLAARGAGGAVCYASGFGESGEEGRDLQAALLDAAGDMPIVGPNCYGLINYLDGVPLWPDQHGGRRVERGVAILSQSSNIAITLTMNRRGLPIAAVITLGNRAQLGAPAVMETLIEDGRVTAVGLLLESLDDAADLARAAEKAREKRIPVVALKLGSSAGGAGLTLSHTASLAGSDAVATAFLKRVGIVRAPSLPVFLDTLRLLHVSGPLPGRDVASMSCSGGEAALIADALERRGLAARTLTAAESARVQATLGDLVTVSNPLDYHTFIWGDGERLAATFSAMLGCGFDICLLMIDLPRDDRCDDRDWRIALDAFERACDRTGALGGVLATLPESLTESLADEIMVRGMVPFSGVEEGLAAIELAADIGETWAAPPAPPYGPRALRAGSDTVLNEWEAKKRLADAGIRVPKGEVVRRLPEAMGAAERIGRPAVVKAVDPGLVRKSDANAVRLGLGSTPDVVAAAGELLPVGGAVLIEEMIGDTVAEVIVGARRDPQVGLVLLLGSGGELTELVGDRVLLIPPATRDEIASAVKGLKVSALIDGFRGRSPGDRGALVEMVLAIQRFALDHADSLVELDVNPVIVRPRGGGAVAVDALMRLVEGEPT